MPSQEAPEYAPPPVPGNGGPRHGGGPGHGPGRDVRGPRHAPVRTGRCRAGPGPDNGSRPPDRPATGPQDQSWLPRPARPARTTDRGHPAPAMAPGPVLAAGPPRRPGQPIRPSGHRHRPRTGPGCQARPRGPDNGSRPSGPSPALSPGSACAGGRRTARASEPRHGGPATSP